MGIGHTVTAEYKLVCNGCGAERNEPFCQQCEPCDSSETYAPRFDGLAAYEAELNAAAEAEADKRKRAEKDGDLVDIFVS